MGTGTRRQGGGRNDRDNRSGSGNREERAAGGEEGEHVKAVAGKGWRGRRS